MKISIKLIIARILTYFGYIIAIFDVSLRWFLMGSPLAFGLKVGYWGKEYYNYDLEGNFVEVKKLEPYGISGEPAIILNYIFTYIHLITIASLFIIFLIRAYLRLTQLRNYKSRGYTITALMGLIILFYITILHIV